MSADGSVRIQVAFESGQSVGANVSTEVADALVKAMAAADTVFEIESEDGTYVLSLAKVVYVRRSDRETQIGFAASA
jgi:hypothetical protein